MAKPTMTDLRATNALPTNPAGGFNGLRTQAQVTEIGIHWWGTPTIADEMQQLRNGSHYHAFVRDWNLELPGFVHAQRLTYHLAIGQSGTIYWINDFEKRTWHLNNGNDRAIGINHMIGQGQRPSTAMLASSKKLLDWLTVESPISAGRANVWGHGECGGIYGGGPAFNASSSCPGPDLLAFARAYRKGQPTPPPTTPPPVPPTHTFYPETGFSTGFGIRDYHNSKGGAAGHLGFPMSDEFQGKIPDGADKIYTLQLFERGLVHWRADEPTGEVRVGVMLRSLLEMQGVLSALE